MNHTVVLIVANAMNFFCSSPIRYGQWFSLSDPTRYFYAAVDGAA